MRLLVLTFILYLLLSSFLYFFFYHFSLYLIVKEKTYLLVQTEEKIVEKMISLAWIPVNERREKVFLVK